MKKPVSGSTRTHSLSAAERLGQSPCSIAVIPTKGAARARPARPRAALRSQRKPGRVVLLRSRGFPCRARRGRCALLGRIARAAVRWRCARSSRARPYRVLRRGTARRTPSRKWTQNSPGNRSWATARSASRSSATKVPVMGFSPSASEESSRGQSADLGARDELLEVRDGLVPVDLVPFHCAYKGVPEQYLRDARPRPTTPSRTESSVTAFRIASSRACGRSYAELLERIVPALSERGNRRIPGNRGGGATAARG